MATCNGCEVRPELHYDAEYQIWVRVEQDGAVSIGMTDISQTRAGNILHVRVRRPGSLHESIDSGTDVEHEIASLDDLGSVLGLD